MDMPLVFKALGPEKDVGPLPIGMFLRAAGFGPRGSEPSLSQHQQQARHDAATGANVDLDLHCAPPFTFSYRQEGFPLQTLRENLCDDLKLLKSVEVISSRLSGLTTEAT
jgi:hypothetical protein